MKNKEKIVNMLTYIFAIVMMMLSFMFISFDSYNWIAFYITKVIGVIMFILSLLLLSIEYKEETKWFCVRML